MDPKHPTTHRAHGNEPNEDGDPQGTREWTERSLRHPGGTEMCRAHINESDAHLGAQELTQSTLRHQGRTGIYQTQLNEAEDPHKARELA